MSFPRIKGQLCLFKLAAYVMMEVVWYELFMYLWSENTRYNPGTESNMRLLICGQMLVYVWAYLPLSVQWRPPPGRSLPPRLDNTGFQSRRLGLRRPPTGKGRYSFNGVVSNTASALTLASYEWPNVRRWPELGNGMCITAAHVVTEKGLALYELTSELAHVHLKYTTWTCPSMSHVSLKVTGYQM